MKIEKLTKVDSKWKYFLPGVTKTEQGFRISTIAPGKDCVLLLKEHKNIHRIPFSEAERTGHVWTMELQGEAFDGIEYCLESEGEAFTDLFGRAFPERSVWGEQGLMPEPAWSAFPTEDFDWEDDKKPCIPYEDSLFYQLHVRSFTKHSSSRVKEKGTFAGILEKLEHLKELGVTAVKLMPVNEFSEVMLTEKNGPDKVQTPIGRLNCWGYVPGYYFAAKAAYADGRAGQASGELKKLVREFHKNNMEIIIELFFTGSENVLLIQEAARFWVREYHVDGIHLKGTVNAALLSEDPYLAGTKLLYDGWDKEEASGSRTLAECNDGFRNDMRRFLKGDEEQINSLIFRSKRNPRGYAVVNYMAETNGFTMMDMVSYDRKHNEDNGENNRDGSDFNYSWNCGTEGPSKKKAIVKMRKKQLRNAFLLLLLSQGTPMLLSGDEFGATKGGNNNSYCQDNAVSWINWNLKNTNRDLFEFVKHAAAFRRDHPVFHRPDEPRLLDYLACGHPDVSYHGVKAWCPEFENFRRQLGIMYCGKYGKKADETEDDYFFVAYNMHWETHEFSLPKLPKGLKWHVSFNTDAEAENGFYEAGEELLLENQKEFPVPARSIVVFSGL